MSAVRCGFCPGATEVIVRRARGLCAACAARLADVRCPDCGGGLMVDDDARTATGPCTAVFCTECEFARELTVTETTGYSESQTSR
jgi:hypothetical protein